jgi:putative endonuclease
MSGLPHTCPHEFASIAAAKDRISARYGLTRLVWAERSDDIASCIEHEKRLKRWRRQWKFALIERDNPEWRDLSGIYF